MQPFEEPAEALTKREQEIKDGSQPDDANNAYIMKNLTTIRDLMDEQNIQLKALEWGWGEPLTQKETAAFLANDGPDVIMGETQMPGFAQNGLLEPFPSELADYVRNNIVDAAWKPMEFNGEIYGVATDPGINVLFWNKQLLKDAGLDPEKAPATWEEWLEISKQVTEAGAGKTYAGGIYAGANFGGYLRFGALLMQTGGGFVDEQGQSTLNAEKNVKAFELLRQLNALNPKGLMTATDEGTFWDAFNKGQIAYVVDGPWRIQGCKDAKIECGISELPIPADGQKGNVTIGASFYAVPNYSKNKEAAFKYINTLIGETVQQNVAEAGFRTPVLKSLLNDEYKAKQPELYALSAGLSGAVAGLPTYDKDGAKAWQAIGDAATKSMLTQTAVVDILNEAQATIEAATR